VLKLIAGPTRSSVKAFGAAKEPKGWNRYISVRVYRIEDSVHRDGDGRQRQSTTRASCLLVVSRFCFPLQIVGSAFRYDPGIFSILSFRDHFSYRRLLRLACLPGHSSRCFFPESRLRSELAAALPESTWNSSIASQNMQQQHEVSGLGKAAAGEELGRGQWRYNM
jgi:hypothetical protein